MSFLPDWPLSFTAQTAFGLLLVAGVIGGHVVSRIAWLPSVTGFMLIGVAVGPSGFSLIGADALNLARGLIGVALALILYRLGLSLNLRSLRNDPKPVLIALVESAATFGVVLVVLSALGVERVVAALAAAIVVSSSPAILIHVAHEVGAAGPVTERAKEMVALNNMLAFLAFSAVLPAGHLANDADWDTTWLQPLYQLLGSILLGTVVAFALYLMTRLTYRSPQYRLALIIGALLLGVGLADALNLSELFVPLVTGIVVRNLEREQRISDVEFGEAFELFFIVLFVYAGAKIDLARLGDTAWLALALVVARAVTKWSSVYVLARGLGLPSREANAGGLLLIPMAGLAIGLAQAADSLFSLQAEQLNALILASVAILETVGPPIAAYAFRHAGEAQAAGARESV
jgi:Kef-type K+ transport system membrane component KefB